MKSADIIQKARDKTGIDAFDNDSFREGLDILVADINASTLVTESGKIGLEKIYVGLLANRLRVSQYLRENRALADAPVPKPLFVLGAPRTGTTLINHLLAADTNRRTLLRWEIRDSVPPAEAGQLYTDPRVIARKAAEAARPAAQSGSAKQHHEAADGPSECTFLHGQDFKSQFLEALVPVPNYSKWILECDMTSTYQYQKKVLQVLQSKAGGIWNLKMPSHALHIDALLDVFPDARIVWTHRDPYQAAASLCSTIAATQASFCDPVDRAEIGRSYSRQLVEHLNRPAHARLSRGQFYDLSYAALVANPMAEIDKLYRWLGDDLTPDARINMEKWLAENPQNRFGKHQYALEDYGLSVAGLEPLLEPYITKYRDQINGVDQVTALKRTAK